VAGAGFWIASRRRVKSLLLHELGFAASKIAPSKGVMPLEGLRLRSKGREERELPVVQLCQLLNVFFWQQPSTQSKW
jgi:hypothetical protein